MEGTPKTYERGGIDGDTGDVLDGDMNIRNRCMGSSIVLHNVRDVELLHRKQRTDSTFCVDVSCDK